MRLPSIVHLDLGLELRGGQRQALLLGSWLAAQGLPVAVGVPRAAPLVGALAAAGVPVVLLPSRRGLDPRNVALLARRLPPKAILHTHEARAASLGAAVRLLRPDVRLVHTRRVSYPLGRGWSRWKYARADAVVAVGADVARVVETSGVSVTAVIPSAIPVVEYPPRTGWHGGRIGIIGALTPQKGHGILLDAMRFMDAVELWVVGEGPLLASLVQRAQTLGVASRVHWKGWQPAAQVLPQLDAVAVPSPHGEGSSGVIKEAWACGVPVVCSDLPANVELVEAEVSGLVAPVGDVGALAHALRRVLEDQKLAARLVANGRKRVDAYDVPVMGAAYRRLYGVLGYPR
jgi:glycosyltransferase involved in cell wall biosynthesis